MHGMPICLFISIYLSVYQSFNVSQSIYPFISYVCVRKRVCVHLNKGHIHQLLDIRYYYYRKESTV